jgi:hypothetical protein
MMQDELAVLGIIIGIIECIAQIVYEPIAVYISPD